MLSPNYVTRACKKGIRDAHGSLFERKILVKSPEPGYKAQRNYEQKLRGEIISENYHRKLLPKIMSENYQLVYQ